MKKPKVKDGKGEIGRLEIVEDLLPPPERLVLRGDEGAYLLTDAQVEEVQRRRADENAPKLTLDEFKERLRREK
jgi:hypothetical protein